MIAEGEFDRNDTSLIALVHAGDRHFQITGIFIRIPAGSDIEPGVQAGNNGDTDDHDHGDDIFLYLLQIPLENFPYIFHRSFSSSITCTRSSEVIPPSSIWRRILS